MLNERKLSETELDARVGSVKGLLKNKRALVKKYGKDAEKVMYGIATKQAKKKVENMNLDKIRSMVEDALKGSVKEASPFVLAADAARDAGKKEFEFPKGSGKMHPVTLKKDVDVKEASAEEEETFHKKLDTLVHKTFGKGEHEKGMKENRFLAASMEDLEQVIRNLAHTGEMSEDEAIEMAIRKLEAMLDGRDDLDENVKEADYLDQTTTGGYDAITGKIIQNLVDMRKYLEKNAAQDKEAMYYFKKADKAYMDFDDYMAYGDSKYVPGALEEETQDVYRDGDVIVDITGMTPGQRAIWKKEKSFSEFVDSADAQRYVDKMKKLKTPEDVEEYYSFDRDFSEARTRNMVNLFKNAEEKASLKEVDLVHVYDKDGKMFGTGERVSTSDDKTLVRFDGSTEKEYPTSQVKNVKEEADHDIGHQDDEPKMLKSDLYRIAKYAAELYKMMDAYDDMDHEVDFPHWWQAKVIKARDYMVGAKHYLDGEEKVDQIDAMLDGPVEEEKTYKINKEALKQKIKEKLTAKSPMKSYIKDFAKSKAPQFKGKSKEKKREMAIAAKLSKQND